MTARVAPLPSGLMTRMVAVPVALDPYALTPPLGPVITLGGSTMGTTWSVSAVRGLTVSVDSLRTVIDATLDRIVAQMSTWVATSDLSQFNRSSCEWQRLPVEFARVLAFALEVARASGGAYDPTVGPLVDCWGFGPRGTRCAPPDEAEIAAARRQCGWEQIETANGCARQPGGVSVDLSAIAKGFAVDAVAELLDSLGVVSYLVEIGGELRGRGMKPDAQPWWVAVEQPSRVDRWIAPDEGAFDFLIALHGLAVATSGDYRKGFASGGRWYSHTIDPRTGCPVTHGLTSVTVLHPECMAADAWSTALMVLGPDEGMALADARDLAAFFVTRTARGLDSRTSRALDAMLQ